MNNDEKFMLRCIELAEQSIEFGESPFGSVVVYRNNIISESGNRIFSSKDPTQHAEMRAILEAQRIFGSSDLSKCTLYTICEPCPMCSFLIRELKFKRVVYGLKSPYMGGHNKWNILEDKDLEKFKEVFGKPPEVVGNFLSEEAKIPFLQAGWGPMFNFKRKKATNNKPFIKKISDSV